MAAPDDRRPRPEVVPELEVAVDQGQGQVVPGAVGLLLHVHKDAVLLACPELALDGDLVLGPLDGLQLHVGGAAEAGHLGAAPEVPLAQGTFAGDGHETN